MDPEALLPLMLLIAVGGSIIIARMAIKKGRDAGPAVILLLVLCFASVTLPIILLLVAALFLTYGFMKPKHRYCPKCGEPNIFYLKSCRRCDSALN